MMVFMPAARLIDNIGKPQTDPVERNVATATTYSTPPDEVTRLTADTVVRKCLFLVLGEALTDDPATPGVTLLKFSADNIAQCSIRNAMPPQQSWRPTPEGCCSGLFHYSAEPHRQRLRVSNGVYQPVRVRNQLVRGHERLL